MKEFEEFKERSQESGVGRIGACGHALKGGSARSASAAKRRLKIA
jgi:hypothetical protein